MTTTTAFARSLLLLFVCLISLSTAAAAADSIAAAIANTARPAADRGQDARRKPSVVLGFMEVERGQHVLDFYAGPGYYSELLAHVVGSEGRVLLYNNALYAQAAHHDLVQRLAHKRLPNVRALNEPSNYLRLEPESLDRVLFMLVYHDLYWQPRDAPEPMGNAEKVLARLHAALKPNGLVVVMDHAANTTPRESAIMVANRLHRIDPNIVREDFERAGFEFVSESEAFRNDQDDRARSVFDPTARFRTDQFMYKFRKRPDGPTG